MIARGQIALVASLAMHAAAVVAIAARPLVPDPIPRTVTTVDLVVPAPAAEPIFEVALVDTSALASMPTPPVVPTPPPARTSSATPRAELPRAGSSERPIDRAAIATAGATLTGRGLGVRETAPASAPPPTGEGGRDLAVPSAFATGFVANSRPLEVVATSGRIEQHGRALLAPDLQVPAEIHADGTVTFHDRGDFEIHFALPRPSRKAIGAAIADWYKDPYAQTRYRAVQEMAPHEQAVEGGWDAGAGGDGQPNGKVEGPGHPSGGPAIPILGGSFDVTAWAMRKFGVGDPYQARKAKLLDATFAQRAALGAQYATNQLARSSVIARDNLAWLASIHDPAERRAAVFAMWDECDEGNGGDDARGQAGDRARVMIVGWIQTHAARGTAAGFTAAEIATFDAQRTSRQHFAPY